MLPIDPTTLLLGSTVKKPSLIKNRLLESTDVDERLKNYVWSSGRLNILKAISLRYDVLELNAKPSDYDFVQIQEPDRKALTKFCGNDRLRNDFSGAGAYRPKIRKVRPNLDGGGGKEIEYWTELDGKLEKTRCRQILSNESIGKIVTSEGSFKDGPRLSEIQDIVLSRLKNSSL